MGQEEGGVGDENENQEGEDDMLEEFSRYVESLESAEEEEEERVEGGAADPTAEDGAEVRRTDWTVRQLSERDKTLCATAGIPEIHFVLLQHLAVRWVSVWVWRLLVGG